MAFTSNPQFLRNVLLLDAATCVVTGVVMAAGSDSIAGLTGLSPSLLTVAGFALLPIAAFIGFVATRSATWPAGVWLVILGNVGWIAGCLAVAFGGVTGANALGVGFVLAQAAIVAVLAELEYTGLRGQSSST